MFLVMGTFGYTFILLFLAMYGSLDFPNVHKKLHLALHDATDIRCVHFHLVYYLWLPRECKYWLFQSFFLPFEVSAIKRHYALQIGVPIDIDSSTTPKFFSFPSSDLFFLKI